MISFASSIYLHSSIMHFTKKEEKGLPYFIFAPNTYTGEAIAL